MTLDGLGLYIYFSGHTTPFLHHLLSVLIYHIANTRPAQVPILLDPSEDFTFSKIGKPPHGPYHHPSRLHLALIPIFLSFATCSFLSSPSKSHISRKSLNHLWTSLL